MVRILTASIRAQGLSQRGRDAGWGPGVWEQGQACEIFKVLDPTVACQHRRPLDAVSRLSSGRDTVFPESYYLFRIGFLYFASFALRGSSSASQRPLSTMASSATAEASTGPSQTSVPGHRHRPSRSPANNLSQPQQTTASPASSKA